jgi:hypothetical protein
MELKVEARESLIRKMALTLLVLVGALALLEVAWHY